MMFLSPEWLVERARMAERNLSPSPGIDVRIQHVVCGGPDGEIRYYDCVQDGLLVGSGRGEVDDPDVILTNTWADELGVLRGEIDPFDVIIEGRVEVRGDQSRLMTIVPILQSSYIDGISKYLVSLIDD